MSRLRWTVVLVAAAGLLGGCGEIPNTLTPEPGTANLITVALDAPANFSQVGIFDAEALGYLTQTDLRVRFITPADPISALEDGRAQIAISNEPAILLARNRHIALASVAAIQQGPQQVAVSCTAASTGRGRSATPGSTHRQAATTTVTATPPRAHPPLHAARCRAALHEHPDARYADAPTYNGLNFVVTENEIINHAPVIRRFVQAVARGYAAARSDPDTATANLVKLGSGLNYAEQLAGVKASLADFFPPAAQHHPWGWQTVKDWNAFGAWLLEHHIISNVNATPDADTNELLAGQGV